jgi:hypothetical protein
MKTKLIAASALKKGQIVLVDGEPSRIVRPMVHLRDLDQHVIYIVPAADDPALDEECWDNEDCEEYLLPEGRFTRMEIIL